MENPDFELFCTEFPEVASKFKSLYESVVTQSVLEAKTQQLIYISHLVAHRYAPAIKAHIPRAMEAGAKQARNLGSHFNEHSGSRSDQRPNNFA